MIAKYAPMMYCLSPYLVDGRLYHVINTVRVMLNA